VIDSISDFKTLFLKIKSKMIVDDRLMNLSLWYYYYPRSVMTESYVKIFPELHVGTNLCPYQRCRIFTYAILLYGMYERRILTYAILLYGM
jgi:hypothetical protein